MENHRYILEPYTGPSSRYICPSCQKPKQFSRYLDTETGEVLADYVGRCNRETGCSYHYKPKDFFQENPDQKPTFAPPVAKRPERPKQLVCIPLSEVKSTFQGYERNTFITFLKAKFGSQIVTELINTYLIGTSDEKWPGPGSTVFWFVDKQGKARAGQVKQFDLNGHTAKHTDTTGETRSKTDWIHSQLKRRNPEPRPRWLEDYLKQDKVTCLFGEHLLKLRPAAPVAIVEAPKTAIIASVYFPGFVWLAIGSLSYLTAGRVTALKGRTVYLFPDLKCFDKWHKQAQELSSIATFITSDLLEMNASEAEREKGLDLADYLTRFPVSDFQKNGMEYEPKTNQPPVNYGEIRKDQEPGMLTNANIQTPISEPENLIKPEIENAIQLQPDQPGPEYYHYSYADLCKELGEPEALAKVQYYQELSRIYSYSPGFVVHSCRLLNTYGQRVAA